MTVTEGTIDPLLFCFLVRALKLKLLRWIPSINNVTSLTGLEALEIETNDSVPLDNHVWCL